MNVFNRFAEWFPEKIVDLNSGIGAILFVGAGLVVFFCFYPPESPYEWILAVSTIFYQAIMLPIILNATRIQNMRSNQAHKAELRREMELLHRELKVLEEIKKQVCER